MDLRKELAWRRVGVLLVSCLPICMCTVCEPGACRGQKGALDPQELELQMVGGCHVGAENQTQVLWKSSQCS